MKQASGMVLVGAWSSLAFGQGGVEKASPDVFSAAYLLQVFASLGVVIGLLFAVLWLLRRFNAVGGSPGGQLSVIASVSLGQRERAVLVDAGGTHLLLGVAPGNVRTLHVFDTPIDIRGSQSGFSKALKHAMTSEGSAS
jgi:flagellar protein FliO/FliZ